MSKIVIAGGTGYIGSHFVVELYNAEFRNDYATPGSSAAGYTHVLTKSSEELKCTAGPGIKEMISSAWKWEKYIKENPFT